MYITRHLVPRSCEKHCTFLNTVSAGRGTDAPLPAAHFPCAWRAFAKRARALVVRSIGTLPLVRLTRRLSASGGCLRSAESTRAALADDNDLVDELTQEVGAQLFEAVLRGRVFAARPAIDGWLQVAVPRIVRRHIRCAAANTLLSPLVFSGGDEERDEFESREPKAGIDGARISQAPAADTARVQMARLLRGNPERIERITSAQRAAFEPWLDGASPLEVSQQLGVSAVAVRIRLMHARRRIAA